MSELVDMSKLKAPKLLEDLNFETLLQERKTAFINLYQTAEEKAHWTARLALESDPVTKLLEENCYLQLLERQRINNAAKATMLAYATGTDLDIIAANYNISRKVIQAADTNATPPLEEILETDTALRQRTQLAFEGMSVAGPRNAYIFHALNAHKLVADVSVVSPSPANVTVTVMSAVGKGQASEEILNAVRNALNDDDVRPIADRVTVQSCEVIDYRINARLYLYNGPEIEPIKQEANDNLTAYVNNLHRLGRDISLSGIYAALHIEGVQRVELIHPTKTIELAHYQTGFCTSINIEVLTSNER